MRSPARWAAAFAGLAAAIAFTAPGTAGADPLFQTTIAYDGPTTIAQGQPVTLAAVLKGDALIGLADRTVKLTLGSGTESQSCEGTTDVAGRATCTIASVSVGLGPQPLEADFAGDEVNAPSSDTSGSAIVFAFGGAFVLGDQTVANGGPSTTVDWWGPIWARDNSLSGGSAPLSFKGFADPPTPTTCGDTWTTRPGNSSGPPAAVPSYMAVLVTSAVTKSGSTISGNTTGIVVVKTDPGYGPAPGHRGTGTVVAIVCKGEL
jgi:hypothetical protein